VSPRKGHPRKGRLLTEEEAQLWDYVTRHDAPLARAASKPKKAKPETAPASPPKKKPLPARLAPAPRAKPTLAQGEYAGVDHNSARKLKRGKRLIEARLDLHGHSRERAHDALNQFIVGAAARGKRVVLVITGYGRQGTSGEPGVLRSMLPRWLGDAPLRRHVLAFDVAQPKDGGPGAFYILLRRERA
jgi:DNA-nicking Smr family endonuclease